MLQTLFSLGQFRTSIYRVPTLSENIIEGKPNITSEREIVLALQRIFFNLQYGKELKLEDVRTHELLSSFGWDAKDRNIQQDASEFQLFLNDRLEEQIKGTTEEPIFTGLFFG